MLRRPNRSIEVFDISLMAVVTKAMGAFLVIMVLLMPYYSSGPIGEQNAADLAKTIADAQKQLDLAVQKLSQAKPSPDEIAKLLDEALRRLREAQELMARLKRDNDALNSQVRRLEDELKEANAENEQLEKELAEQQQVIFSAEAINWDCLDVRVDLALLPRQDVYSITTSDNRKVNINQILNFSRPTTGGISTITDEQVREAIKDSEKEAPGVGVRFNTARVYSRLNKGDIYMLAVLFRDKKVTKVEGYEGYALRDPGKACKAIVSRQYIDPKTKDLVGYYTNVWTLDAYGAVAYEVTWRGEDVLTVSALSAETKKWWDDQLKRAVKVSAKPAIDRVAMLKSVDGWTVPRDKGECQVLAARATQLQVDAKVYNDKDRAGMAAVMADCNKGDFAAALQKVKAEMHRTIK